MSSVLLTELVNHLWQSTVFAGVAALLALWFRKNHAAIRYRIWLAASIKFLVPFSLFVALGNRLGPLVAEPAPAPKTVMTPITASTKPADSAQAARTARNIDAEQPMRLLKRMAEPLPSLTPATPAVPDASDSTLWPDRLMLAGLAVWLLGLAVSVTLWLRQWLRIRARLRAASPLELDVPAMIPALSSPAAIEPSVFGILHPVLLLPENITTQLSADEIETILLHESAHVERRDNLAAALHMVVESVFWFNPVVWWIGKRLVEERERACDERVLNASVQPETYAEAILSVCKLHLKTPLICAAGVASSNLRERIEAIMNYRTPWNLSLVRKSLLAGIGVAAACIPIFVGVLNARQLAAQTEMQSPFTFASIDVPGASSTTAHGIDGLGRIVGSFVDTGGTHGFLYANGSFSTIDFPGSPWTVARGINSLGQIVGGYGPGGESGNHGFLLSGGTFSSFDVPESMDTVGYGLNSRGQIVGTYLGSDRLRHGFRLTAGNYSLIEVPDSHAGSAQGINDSGDIVGLSGDGPSATAFLLSNGVYSKVQPPGNGYAAALGLNSMLDIVGQDGGPQGPFRGFRRSGERFTALDLPDDVFSSNAQSINDLGQVVGEFVDRNGATHGYLATPTTLRPGPVDPGAANRITLLDNRTGVAVSTVGPQGPEGPVGPQGPPGPPGPPGTTVAVTNQEGARGFHCEPGRCFSGETSWSTDVRPIVTPPTLQGVRQGLQHAAAAIERESRRARGSDPSIPEASSAVEGALQDLNAAIAFVRTHPDDGPATATASPAPNFNFPPRPTQNRNINQEAGLFGLKAAYDSLAKSPGGDLGGVRGRINKQIADAAAALLGRINTMNANYAAGNRHPLDGPVMNGGMVIVQPRLNVTPQGPATNLTTTLAVSVVSGAGGIEFVRIPAGTFQMGCSSEDAQCLPRENPPHAVRITKDFELGRYEVTQAQWQAVMGTNPSQFKGDALPVETVTWNDVQEFLKKLNARNDGYQYRLPTEAEWEYAARAGTTGPHPGNPGEIAWSNDNAGNKTHPVGGKKPNAWGLYDMVGNVWEWVQDSYDEKYYNGGSTTDPQGPASGAYKVLRGGSWYSLAARARVSFRNYEGAPGYRFNGEVGFRLLRER